MVANCVGKFTAINLSKELDNSGEMRNIKAPDSREDKPRVQKRFRAAESGFNLCLPNQKYDKSFLLKESI